MSRSGDPETLTGGAAEEAGILVAKLREAGSGNTTAAVALLWTWLERHLQELGSLLEKPPTILAQAHEDAPFRSIDEQTLEWLAEFPLRNAARLLARIGIALGEAVYPLAEPALGFDGEEVFVCWRRTDLPRRTGGPSYPPSAREHPSVTTLIPSIVVCPAKAGGISLTFPRLGGPEWDLATAKLERGIGEEGSSPLEVHLDSLGDAGFSSWHVDPKLKIASLREEEAADPEIEAAIGAVDEAISGAEGQASVLVMPELAACGRALAAIAGDLASAADAPALTVVGSYHVRDTAGAGDPHRAGFVNEAVVFGPAGGELWRHRKLSSAGGTVKDADGKVVRAVEDITLGDSLAIVPSPLGVIAVVTCLDSFAKNARERLASSPANVLLVPSLSPRVDRHRDSLQQLVQALWAVAFVCNRSPGTPGNGATCWDEDENRSFWTIQRRRFSEPQRSDARPSFVFRLSRFEDSSEPNE